MATSKQLYPCFSCRRAGYEVQVFLDGKDASGHTKYLNEDGTSHTHLGSSQQQPIQQQQYSQEPQRSTATAEPSQLKLITARLEYAISLLEKLTNANTTTTQ